MIITKAHIRNFRALKDVTFNLSTFSCVIGENNSGKSSLMQAIKLFLRPVKLSESDYYEKGVPVVITLTMDVSENDLKAITNEEHRARISEVLRDGVLSLTQSFPLNEKLQMTCTRSVPKEERWLEPHVSEILKGKTGAALKQAALDTYPEVSSSLDTIEGALTITKVKAVIAAHCNALGPENRKDDDFAPVPTGLDASVRSILPDPIYIEAVKDISEDVKTSKEAVFGKLLGLLLNVIEAETEMQTFRNTLTDLNTKLNVLTKQDGTTEDNRFRQVIALERTIQAYLREHFPDATVHIDIPPPDLQKILQAAAIDIHDGGVAGNIETKGDGLKRSVLFSLFRAFVQLSKPTNWNDSPSADIAHRHIILFEEPELYLHPRAQQVLFDSLTEVSKSFQVIVTTHSPLFFSAYKTKTFAKLSKAPNGNGGASFSELISVDLEKDLSIKDEFQILCYENNNVAFFANSVLLVEGDSDVAALKHLSRTVNPLWDFDKGNVRLVKVGGKGNFARYIEFFKRFRVTTMVLADLDVLLGEFDKLCLRSDSPCIQMRADLLQKVSDLVGVIDVDGSDTKETWKARGQRFLHIIASVINEIKPAPADIEFLRAIQEEVGLKQAKLKLLKSDASLRLDKLALLRALRSEGIMILERGALEDYYPSNITGADKTAKATDFRKKVVTRDIALALAANVPVSGGQTRNEIEAIFARAFNETDALRDMTTSVGTQRAQEKGSWPRKGDRLLFYSIRRPSPTPQRRFHSKCRRNSHLSLLFSKWLLPIHAGAQSCKLMTKERLVKPLQPIMRQLHRNRVIELWESQT
jgi:energy-coupling factor transporter ATP-binding protein EcfA2